MLPCWGGEWAADGGDGWSSSFRRLGKGMRKKHFGWLRKIKISWNVTLNSYFYFSNSIDHVPDVSNLSLCPSHNSTNHNNVDVPGLPGASSRVFAGRRDFSTSHQTCAEVTRSSYYFCSFLFTWRRWSYSCHMGTCKSTLYAHLPIYTSNVSYFCLFTFFLLLPW